MDISLSTSVSGMHAAITKQDVAANDVANINTDSYEEKSAIQSATNPGTKISSIVKTPNSDGQPSNTDLATETTNQISNVYSMGANSKAFKVQSEMLGEIIDLKS